MDTQTHRHTDARTDKIPSSRAPVGAKKSKHKRCYFLFFELYIESQKKRWLIILPPGMIGLGLNLYLKGF